MTTSGTLFDAFVDDSTNTVADQLVSLADTVDDYEDEVLLFSVKQDAVIELSTSFEELEDLKDEYFDMLGTNVTLDTLYDDVIVAAEDAFDNYFVSINSSYYNKYEYLTILDTLLIDEKEVSLNSVKLSLQEYLNPVTRFYDIEHHEVLAVNYTEVINDYYSEDAFDCDNLVDDWNIAVVDSVQDSIDDYTELLEDGIAYIDDEDLDDATFMAALSAYLDDVLVGMKEDFEDRVDEQLLGYNSLVIDQRQEFASLLETKTLYDTASDSERALLYTYLVDSLDELQELSLDTRLSYDIEFLLYVLGAENDLVNHEPYLLVSVSSSVEYLGYVYDAYITTNSDRGLDVVSDALLIPTWITTSDNIESCGAYTRDQIVALLVDYGSKVDDVDALELKFTNAIAKADILLSSSSLSDSNRCLIQLIK